MSEKKLLWLDDCKTPRERILFRLRCDKEMDELEMEGYRVKAETKRKNNEYTGIEENGIERKKGDIAKIDEEIALVEKYIPETG